MGSDWFAPANGGWAQALRSLRQLRRLRICCDDLRDLRSCCDLASSSQSLCHNPRSPSPSTVLAMALALLKDAWRDHRTACVAAAAAASVLGLWAIRRRANPSPAPTHGGRLLGQAERVVYEYGRQMNGSMMVRERAYACLWRYCFQLV